MRHALFALLALTIPGCGMILDLDSLQHGDAGPAAIDGSSEAGTVDAYVSRDAYRADTVIDTNPPDTFIPPDAFVSPDAFIPPDAWIAPDTGSDGGNDGGTDSGIATVGVGGTIVGVTGSDTIMLANGSDTRAITAGTTSFTFRVAPGSAYDVSVTAPSSLLCVVYRGRGTASADVTNLFVGCSTAVGIVSYFPFDGSLHASRGVDFTTTAGPTPAYVADRAGQMGHALAPLPGGADNRLVRPFNGDTTLVAANSTQATVTLWALLPAALSPPAGLGLFGHTGPTSLSIEAQIQWRTGTPYFEMYFYWDGGFSQANITTAVALDRDHWHHVALALTGPSGAPDSFSRSIFVDGVRQNQVLTCCGWGNTTQYWLLGASPVPRDDIRLYDRMLSDAEIAAVYAAENVH